MIHEFHITFTEYFEGKLVEMGDFLSENDNMVKYIGIVFLSILFL